MQGASSKQQTEQKCKHSHQQIGLPPHSALRIRGETTTKKLSTNLTLYKAHTPLTQPPGPTLGRQKPEGRKISTLKPGKRRHQTQ